MSDRLSRSEPVARLEGPQELQSIASPPAPALPQSLSRELQQLSRNQCVYVAGDGLVFADRDKGSIVDQKIKPLVSFRKESEGAFRVYAGLPPRNATFCGSGEIPEIEKLLTHPELHGPVVLNSGDWLALTPLCPVPVPKTKNTGPKHAGEKLGELMASAQVGDTLVLGRGIEATCAKVVSRCHITVKILDRRETSKNEFELRALAIPGIVGSHPIFEVNPDGTLDQIVGSKLIQAGSTIQVGSEGERFTLPHPRGSLEEGSVIFHRSILLGDKEAHQSVLSLHGEVGLHKARFDALKHFVVEGVAMIRDGQPLKALDHLKTESKELEAAGYTLSVHSTEFLEQVTQEAIERNLRHVAGASQPHPSRREVAPCLGALKPGVQASNDHERQLLDVWHKNLALIFAGEYVRALQDMNQGAISDYTPLIGGKSEIDPRADVALFFVRHGVDLSDGHFINLYKDKREAALAVVHGSQTTEEETAFRNSLLAAPLKTPVPTFDGFSIARNEDGYRVVPPTQRSQAFIVRSTGPAVRLTQPETLQGGDTLYIGSRKFILPTVSSDASVAKKS